MVVVCPRCIPPRPTRSLLVRNRFPTDRDTIAPEQVDARRGLHGRLNGPYGGSGVTWQNARWEEVGFYALGAGRHTPHLEAIPVRVEAQGKTLATRADVDDSTLEL